MATAIASRTEAAARKPMTAAAFALRAVWISLLLASYGTVASAALGDSPAELLTALADHAPTATQDGHEAADGFSFAIDEEAGVAIAISGKAVLSEANLAFLGALVGAGSGYGSAIAGPVSDFFRTRSAGYVGAGEVVISVLSYDLVLTVTGPAPYFLEFRFQPQRVSEQLFPATVRSLGPRDASYVIRVFSDFQCPFCRMFVTEAWPLIEATLLGRGDVRYELHHFPLRSIHPNADVAAQAAECVAERSAAEFWPYHDALFEQQERWGALAEPQPTLVAIAAELGLGGDGVAECLRVGRFAGAIEDAYRAAAAGLLLTSTPSVFVNGLRLGEYNDPDAYLRSMRLSDALAARAAREGAGGAGQQ